MARSPLPRLALAVLAGAALVAGLPAAHAEGDAAKEARLLALDGKFGDAETILRNADEAVRNDAKLRFQLGDLAVKWSRRKEATEKVPGLLFAREQFAAAAQLQPDDVEAATAAVETALELIDIQIEAKQPATAKEHAGWAVKIGESVLEGGANTVDLRLAVAKAHDQNAKLSHKVQDFDSIVADYGRSADLLVSCADEAKKPAEALGQAARVYLDLARFIAEGRPMDEEKRDDEALVKGIEVATRACETKGAGKDEYTVHLLLLREAYRQKTEGDFPPPYMEELGKREGVDGLDLQIPKAEGWKALDRTTTGDWSLIYDRKLEGDDTALRVMIRAYTHKETWAGKSYDRVEDIVKDRFEAQKTDEFEEVSSSTEPEKLDTGKKGPEIWTYRIAGKTGGRNVRSAEWYLMRSKKEGMTYRIRIVDYRILPDLGEPDVVVFVNTALGIGAEDDDKGKKGKKKKR